MTPTPKPPRYITVRFKDSGSLLDATVLSFKADRGWVGGHVYKLVPPKKPAKKGKRK